MMELILVIANAFFFGHSAIHTKQIKLLYCEVLWHRFLEIHYFIFDVESNNLHQIHQRNPYKIKIVCHLKRHRYEIQR